MARQRNRARLPEDLTPYEGCSPELEIGMIPLAVGWLERGSEFDTGPLPDGFAAALLAFCQPEFLVCPINGRWHCGLENHPIAPVRLGTRQIELGKGEIRVIGDEDIFAAPDLIYHYVVEHGYRPPDSFVRAVLMGPPAGSPEHRAYIKFLQ
jgi:hypothetical protein